MTQLYAYDPDTRTVFFLSTGKAALIVEDQDTADATHATGRIAAVGMEMAVRRAVAIRKVMESQNG